MRQRDTRKNHRELVCSRRLIEVEPILSLAGIGGKGEVLTTLDLVGFHTVGSGRFRCQKRRGSILVTWTDYVDVTVLARREVKFELFARRHRQRIAGTYGVGFVRSVYFDPVATNFMPAAGHVSSARPFR